MGWLIFRASMLAVFVGLYYMIGPDAYIILVSSLAGETAGIAVALLRRK